MIFFPPFLWRILLFLLFVNGCVPVTPNLTHDDKSVGGSPETEKPLARSVSLPRETSDLEKLAQLWHLRSKERSVSDYPIGPGDILEISVTAIEELRSRVVRVSGDGTISLPFIGKITAAGLTEEELKE